MIKLFDRSLKNNIPEPLPAAEHPLPPPKEQEPQGAERRSEARYPTDDPAEIELLHGGAGLIHGTVLDVSRSGMRVALAKRIDRGEQVKVRLQENVIFAEVRYCYAVAGGFHVGLLIKDLVHGQENQENHVGEDALSFYIVGRGLSLPEVIEVRAHLVRCDSCRTRLRAKESLLNPARSPRARWALGMES